MNYFIKNRGIPRGFIGKTMVLEPGVNEVDKDLFRVMAENCPKVNNHRSSGQLTVLGNAGEDTVRVQLEPVTDVGAGRPATTYKCHKYKFAADEEKAIPTDQFAELAADPYFQGLRGDGVQVRGTDAEASTSSGSETEVSGSLISGE